MTYTVTVKPSGLQFQADENETLLNAAIRQGLNFPYGCRNGVCGSCKGEIIEGSIIYPDENTDALSIEEQRQNISLVCQAHAASNLTLKVHLIDAVASQTIKKLPCRVFQIEKLAHDVMKVSLKLPPTERLQFFAGQYIDILLKDGRKRSFSLANAPHQDESLELHIRHIDGGNFTGFVFEELEEKAILRVEGPLGSFFLREDSTKPIILMAGGTGFAPIKGIIEHSLAEQLRRPIHLYWGVRAKRDLYMHTLAQSWADEYEHIHYHAVLSEPSEHDNWSENTGFVHEAILEEFPSLAGYEVYASGPPVMVKTAYSAFIKQGLATNDFFSDAFEFQKP